MILAALGLGVVFALAALLVFAWPNDAPRPSLLTIAATDVPAPGADPVRVADGRFWLVNLRADDGQVGEFGVPTAGGVAGAVVARFAQGLLDRVAGRPCL